MTGRDEHDPIDKLDQHNDDRTGLPLPTSAAPSAEVANAGPLPASPVEELHADPAFYFPAIPIAPARAISAPASRALASGDDLLDYVRDPPRQPSPKPAHRIALPDDLDPELFIKPLPPAPNRPVSPPLSAITRADRLTESLRPEPSEADSPFEQYPAPDFPITPFATFNAPLHAEGVKDQSTPPGAPSFPRAPLRENVEWVGIDAPNFRLQPEPVTRIPNFGHLGILLAIASIGFVIAGLVVRLVFHFHLWGVTTIAQATDNIHYTLLSMAVLYVSSFAIAFFFFPRLWERPFFAALQWNAPSARRHFWLLFSGAAFCFVLAMVDELIIPGPTNAPIDKMFSNTSAAWLLFAFGVTVAPFFEEMTFRGFLLPALCTAIDWAVSKRNDQPPPPLGPDGHPQWSLPAMIAGSLITSLPFAAMHAEQIAHSIGPLVLLYCVSLVLCFARLATRSLAASTLLHATYNFLLFFMMLVGTGGFKHLDKM